MILVDSTEFWKLIDQIETGESRNNAHWGFICKEARFQERVKAYEKMFYRFLDGGNVS